jgi:hypothetical protein
VNATQIGAIGRMFMSDETQAVEMLKDYDVTHVLVFASFGIKDASSTTLYDAGYGDEGKWRWMAKIGELDDTLYGNYTLGKDWVDINDNGSVDSNEIIDNVMGNSTVLYKLMHYASDTLAYGSSSIQLEHFKKAYFSQSQETAKWFPDANGYFIAVVCVYEVIY